MPSIADTLQLIHSELFRDRLTELYGDGQEALSSQTERYSALVNEYSQRFGGSDVYLFSSPGRSEISGNHTDHNLGKVIAASINMDCIGVAEKTGDNKVSIRSITYNEDFTIDLGRRAENPNASGTYTLVEGILNGFEKNGYSIGGFNVCLTSDVISAAGVSSSASFEMLICAILNFFYNDNQLDIVACAKIGQYAENTKWDKQSGLLDQLACGHGGLISIDFKDAQHPVITNLNFEPVNQAYKLLIVPTGGNHADLSQEYSSIPSEMKAVAKELGAQVLGDLSAADVLSRFQELREKAGDRAVLRALHFFEENDRVDKQIKALDEGRPDEFLKLVNESGNSSWKWLQNVYSNLTPETQGVSLYLAVTELFIKKNGAGACRVHGGGFAGVIMALLPKDLVDSYTEYMKSFGVDHIYSIRMRKYGAVNVNLLLSDDTLSATARN
ncbi:galactokinase [Paenibacillus sabinae]|uniref:Galactokinase n=1 Tax=Paenibacillus sabinae T27 TaxID=1268072 RepID=X5A3C9_9BACL|nr:galactokinase family protein [Paenibacillus sabinae]AHV98314.1 galactokinase [Paenibacillus sabinae T27]